MDNQPPAVLSYANPPKTKPSRFRPLISLAPFYGGMVAGVLLCMGIIACSPDVPLWTDASGALIFLVLGIPATAAFAFALMFLLCCIFPGRVAGRRWLESAFLGMVVPVVAIGFGELVSAIFGLTDSDFRRQDNGMILVAGLAASLAVGTPILLVRRSNTEPSAPTGAFRMFVLIATTAPILSLVAAVLIKHIQARAFDRGCADLAAWVKVNYPAPGSHTGLTLPAQFHKLAADHSVDAVVLPDGRVVLLLKTSIDSSVDWTGVAYCSGSVLPGEIKGNPGQIQQFTFPDLYPAFPGLYPASYEYSIEKRLDSQRFIVGWNADW